MNLLRQGDRLLGQIWLANLGRTRWTVQVRLAHGASGDLVATAKQVGHFLCLPDRAPAAIPEADLKTYWEHQWQQ